MLALITTFQFQISTGFTKIPVGDINPTRVRRRQPLPAQPPGSCRRGEAPHLWQRHQPCGAPWLKRSVACGALGAVLVAPKPGSSPKRRFLTWAFGLCGGENCTERGGAYFSNKNDLPTQTFSQNVYIYIYEGDLQGVSWRLGVEMATNT